MAGALAIDYRYGTENRVAHVLKVRITPAEEGGFWASLDIPGGGCTTQGETLREVQKNMYEAMELFLDDYPHITDYCLAFEVTDA
ncbi:MAG: type II toxin-antitoxin system HicB family antitoxin [Defluviitaleaceae bacterium]|nr:type II toxin-antitoxin system HicB family antitoxin [Defluviitaleaceae bacterium]